MENYVAPTVCPLCGWNRKVHLEEMIHWCFCIAEELKSFQLWSKFVIANHTWFIGKWSISFKLSCITKQFHGSRKSWKFPLGYGHWVWSWWSGRRWCTWWMVTTADYNLAGDDYHGGWWQWWIEHMQFLMITLFAFPLSVLTSWNYLLAQDSYFVSLLSFFVTWDSYASQCRVGRVGSCLMTAGVMRRARRRRVMSARGMTAVVKEAGVVVVAGFVSLLDQPRWLFHDRSIMGQHGKMFCGRLRWAIACSCHRCLHIVLYVYRLSPAELNHSFWLVHHHLTVFALCHYFLPTVDLPSPLNCT